MEFKENESNERKEEDFEDSEAKENASIGDEEAEGDFEDLIQQSLMPFIKKK